MNHFKQKVENNLFNLLFFLSLYCFLSQILQNYAAMKMVGPFGPPKGTEWWREGEEERQTRTSWHIEERCLVSEAELILRVCVHLCLSC